MAFPSEHNCDFLLTQGKLACPWEINSGNKLLAKRLANPRKKAIRLVGAANYIS
jgi:hypothetical protein